MDVGSKLWNRWTYLGTDAAGHHFRYGYHRGSRIKFRNFVIADSGLRLHFRPLQPQAVPKSGIKAEPVCVNENIVGFRLPAPEPALPLLRFVRGASFPAPPNP